MLAAQGDVFVIAPDFNLIALTNNPATFIDTRAHGGFLSAMADRMTSASCGLLTIFVRFIAVICRPRMLAVWEPAGKSMYSEVNGKS